MSAHTDAEHLPAASAGRGHPLAGVLAGLLHLAIGVWPLSASGLLAPPWALGVIGVGWLVAAVALWRIWRQRPWWALVVPPVTVAVWAAFITFGDRALGWTG